MVVNVLDKVKEVFESSSLFTDVLKDMPIFRELIRKYEQNQPFAGLSIAIAHVIVPNTLPLIYSAIVGGAEIVVTDTIPSVIDPKTLAVLKQAGIPFNSDFVDATDFDFAIDCNAYFINLPPRLGISEVTRSGIHQFETSSLNIPIVNVDDSDTKKIETFLGNPLAVKEAFGTFVGDPEKLLADKIVVVLGFGKIGRGLARVFSKFSKVQVMDVDTTVLAKAIDLGFEAQLIGDKAENTQYVQEAELILTSTGYPNVVTTHFDKKGITASYLINVGAVDEFGEDYSEDEILLSKHKPFNFNLVPPTGNAYIDPILAIHLDAIRFMIEVPHDIGVIPISEEVDERFVKAFENANYNIQDLLGMYFDRS